MNNVSDIKPWFREDLANALRSVYFAAKSSGLSGERLIGFLGCVGSLCLMWNLKPGEIVVAEDVQKMEVRR